MAWEPAEKVQKNSQGQYRAMIGGEWIPVAKAQKNEQGQYRVDRALREPSSNEPSLFDRGIAMNREAGQGIANILAGAVKGASQIGATILSPLDYAGLTGMTSAERRAAVTGGLQEMGADPNSLAFKGGEIGTEILGTAGTGGALAKGVMAGAKYAPTIAPKIAAALQSGGFSAGAPAARALSMEGAKNAALRVGGGAASGAAMASMINPEDAGAGAAIGGAIPIIGKFAGESGRLLKEYAINPLFKPSKAALNKLIEDAGGVEQARVAIDRAIKAGKTMSGESYTLGQAGKNAGLASTERARSAVNPENFQPIYQAQREARVKALQGIGQDDVAVNAAIESRDKAAQVLYGKAFSSDAMRRDLTSQKLKQKAVTSAGGIHQRIPDTTMQNIEDLATPELRELMHRPAFESAAKQAITLARNKGINIGDPTQSLQGLHYIKLALDDALQPTAATSLGRNASASIMDMRDKLSVELEKIAPLYGNAKSTYSEMSKPINQMKIGQRLTDTLTGEAVKHGANASQNSASFYRALKNAPSIAKSETGMRQPLNKIFEEGQLSTIKQVAKELAKDVDLQNLGRGVGSDTAQKMARANITRSLSDLVNTTRTGRAAADVITLGAKGRINARLDAMLQSPEYAGKALADLSKPQRVKLADLLANPVVRALPVISQSR